MQPLNASRFGVAVGAVGAVFYIGCILLMAVVPQEGLIRFFNILAHGVDVTTVLRPSVPWWESALGVVLYFVLGWIGGALVAGIYNHLGSHGSKHARGSGE